MLTSVLLAGACLLRAAAGDDPQLVPGQRLEQVERVELVIETPGIVTLGRSNGALVAGKDRSDEGWLVKDLKPGRYTIELPGGPGDITAIPGHVDPMSAESFLNRAITQMGAGDFSGERLSLLACRARSGKPTTDALARMFQGDLLRREGQTAEARELLLGAREGVEAYGDPTLIAFGADSLGQIALAGDEWDLAQQCFERVRDLATDPGAKAFAISRLARTAAGRREIDLARKLHEEALSTLTEDSGPRDVSEVAFHAGCFMQKRAEFARAIELLERAASSAPSWNQQLPALGQISQVEMTRGHYGAALRMLERVDALAAEHSPSPYDRQVLRARAELAFSLGEFGEAREHLAQLLVGTDDPTELSEIRTNLALVSFMQDDDEGATQLYDEVLSASPDAEPVRWRALNGKATVLLEDDRAKEAEPLAREALAVAQAIDDPHLQTASLITVSGVEALLGQGESARAHAEASLESVRTQGANDLLLYALHNVARAALVQGDEAAVKSTLDRAWTESLAVDVGGLPSLETAQVRSRLSELSDWSEVAADLTARHAGATRDTLADGFRRAEQWKARTLRSDIQGHAEVAATLDRDVASLVGDGAIVEYVGGETKLYAFVLTAHELRFVDLGAKRPIETRARAFIDELAGQAGLAPPDAVARDGGELYDRLLRPLALEAQRLTIVPSGELARLPFDALVVSSEKTVRNFDDVVFVVDKLDVGYAPSSATLVALAQRATPAATATVALLIGDPVYASEQEPSLLAARGSSARLARLPHTREEVTRIARMLLSPREGAAPNDELDRLDKLEGERDVRLSTPTVELRLGREASADALSSLSPRARLIHIAAHGQVDRWDTRRTGLALAWDEDHQGLFSLEDIAALHLDADLVVLSACETADGRLLNGEGVQSMAEAFLGAGARGVVATLWPVSDSQSRTLMERFERAYLDGEPPDRALRAAKRELRVGHPARGALVQPDAPDARRGHPHSWAAFVFSGTAGPRAP
jgi:CHAT domain-containing protein/Tfp pilus assembly protein PilF